MKNLKPLAALALLATLTLNALPLYADILTGAPDLIPSAWMTDADGYIMVRVSNLGGTLAAPSQIRVWHFTKSEVVSADATPALAFSGPYIKTHIKLTPGWPVVVIADCYNAVAESNETNNSHTFSTR
jgi:hypothetical protein